MLILPRPSILCQSCMKGEKCSCRCHDLDLTNGKHYHIRIEENDFIVKPVVDLEHFRG